LGSQATSPQKIYEAQYTPMDHPFMQ
jgi:hypothetical protein